MVESACQCRKFRSKFDPWVGKIPWRREWLPTPVSLPGKIPWTEEPGVLQPEGVAKSQERLRTHTCTWLEAHAGLSSSCFFLTLLSWVVLCVCAKSLQSCPWRDLGWVAMPFFRGSSRPRDWSCVSYISWVVLKWSESCSVMSNSLLLMDRSLSGSSVHGIIILHWVAISFSRGSSQPRDWTSVSCIAGRFFTARATRETLSCLRTSWLAAIEAVVS